MVLLLLTGDLRNVLLDSFVFLWILEFFHLGFEYSALLSLLEKHPQLHASVALAAIDQNVAGHEKDQ